VKLASGILLLACAGSAHANDTTASTGAGGIQIQQTEAIDMVSEDLFVSAELVRVRYLFRNRTGRKVLTVVAFPMPDRDLSQEYGRDVAYPSDFQTMVNGRPVKSQLERKALVQGRDHRALLEQLGIPIAPDSIEEAAAAMDRLPQGKRRQLRELGLVGVEEWAEPIHGSKMKKHLVPLWTVRDVWWWHQIFPSQQKLSVEHRYAPGVGGESDTPLRIKQYRSSEDVRWLIDRYCIDQAFLAGLDRKARADQLDGPGLPDRRIDYILTTGANWRSPIGEFRLVIDKGKPGNLVSFCGNGARKIGPTRFEIRRKNWRPDSDLHVLIIEPQER
jgi:uncharacterized protein DUF4424